MLASLVHLWTAKLRRVVLTLVSDFEKYDRNTDLSRHLKFIDKEKAKHEARKQSERALAENNE